jgi:uncharacterized protein (DUF1684 family)
VPERPSRRCARALEALALLALATSTACSSGPPPPDRSGQLADIEATREATDRFMRESNDSPIPQDKRDVLLPLRYFPPDPQYSVPAALRLSDPSQRPVAEMPTSTGTIMRYQRVGILEFTFESQPMSLAAFVPEGTSRISELFVPFADITTGEETYSAGRYLNLEPTSSGTYTIDFNYAYNPYCAYNKQYECPFPPPSNRLKVPIRAGEMAPPAE